MVVLVVACFIRVVFYLFIQLQHHFAFYSVISNCKLVSCAGQDKQTWKTIAPLRPPNFAVNLKHLPPIDPFRKGKLNNSCSRAAAKALKRNPNQGMKFVASDKDIVKNPSSGMGNIVLEDTSSTSSNQNTKIQPCGNSTSPTQTEEGSPSRLLLR